MKILFVNESTKIKGGVDSILQMEIEGLRKNSIEIDLFEFSHSEIVEGSGLERIKNVNLYFSQKKKLKLIKERLDWFNPDIIHYHNTYPFLRKPLWSDKIFKNIKVVQHLHNFYPFCLNSFFYKKGNICTECFDNDGFRTGIINACYDYSKIKSVLTTFNRPIPSKWIEYSKNVNLFLGVSQFIVEKYIEFGVNREKIKKLYNGISIIDSSDSVLKGRYVLFLGNIVISKGVEIVCKLAQRNRDIKYKITGLGRDLLFLKSKYNHLSNLTFVGYADNKRKNELIKNCSFLIFPAQSWESFGLVIIEALAYGKKIIISGFGGTSELVEDGVTGFIVKNNDINSFEKVVRNLWDNLVNSTIGIEKQEELLAKFSQKKHIENLIKYYKSIL